MHIPGIQEHAQSYKYYLSWTCWPSGIIWHLASYLIIAFLDAPAVWYFFSGGLIHLVYWEYPKVKEPIVKSQISGPLLPTSRASSKLRVHWIDFKHVERREVDSPWGRTWGVLVSHFLYMWEMALAKADGNQYFIEMKLSSFDLKGIQDIVTWFS